MDYIVNLIGYAGNIGFYIFLFIIISIQFKLFQLSNQTETHTSIREGFYQGQWAKIAGPRTEYIFPLVFRIIFKMFYFGLYLFLIIFTIYMHFVSSIDSLVIIIPILIIVIIETILLLYLIILFIKNNDALQYKKTKASIMIQDYLNRKKNDNIFIKILINNKKQSNIFCMFTILLNSENIQFVKNQNEKICKFALSKNPFVLKYIKEQTEYLCMYALETTLRKNKNNWKYKQGIVIESIKTQTPKICNFIIDNWIYEYRFIENFDMLSEENRNKVMERQKQDIEDNKRRYEDIVKRRY